MNIPIRMPRPPAWLVRALDRYTDWADRPAGIVLWGYTVLRMDFVTAAIGMAVCATYGWWVGSLLWGFVLGVPAFLFALVMVELCMPPRKPMENDR